MLKQVQHDTCVSVQHVTMDINSQELLVCTSCKNENDSDANFCDQCGTLLKPVLICEHCKAENDEQAKFCDQCGKALDTPEFQQKQRVKLIVGLTLLAIGFISIVFMAISDMKKGKNYPYGLSTKDGVYREAVEKLRRGQ